MFIKHGSCFGCIASSFISRSYVVSDFSEHPCPLKCCLNSGGEGGAEWDLRGPEEERSQKKRNVGLTSVVFNIKSVSGNSDFDRRKRQI